MIWGRGETSYGLRVDFFGQLGVVLGGLGSLLGASWADLEASWGFGGPLGIVLGLLEVILEPLGAVLGLLGAVLEPFGAILGWS